MNSKILAECASFEVLECEIAVSIFILSIIYKYAAILIYWNMSNSCCFYMPPQFVFLRCFNKRFVSIIWIFITLNKYCYTTFLAWTDIGCIHFVCFLITCFVICSLTLNTVSRNFNPFIVISLCFFIVILRSCCVFFSSKNYCFRIFKN